MKTWMATAEAFMRTASSIETDQYYAWGRDLADSTEMINAKVNAELNAGLAEFNASRSWEPKDCERVTKKLVARFRMFLYHELELWARSIDSAASFILAT